MFMWVSEWNYWKWSWFINKVISNLNYKYLAWPNWSQDTLEQMAFHNQSNLWIAVNFTIKAIQAAICECASDMCIEVDGVDGESDQFWVYFSQKSSICFQKTL